MLMPTDFEKIFNTHLIDHYTHDESSYEECIKNMTDGDCVAGFITNSINCFTLLTVSEPLKEYENITFLRKSLKDYKNITEEMWRPYWERIVEVFSVIETNKNNFYMDKWHGVNSCGTTHCIAGWAQFIYEEFTNIINCAEDGEKYLSPLIRPFFYCSASTDDGNAEEAVLNYLILPVLEEARKEGLIPIKNFSNQKELV